MLGLKFAINPRYTSQTCDRCLHIHPAGVNPIGLEKALNADIVAGMAMLI
ncbi:hypothetical protein [Microcoleus asticus]|uniref:Transposase n=1 Tax=Microcoleus asticus IPMA8 TaxID=2563858 RepID=A0ABX2D1K9_9CYAN|nr:hypothetical protein [Microcoleus asticus IPMA8]